MRRSGAPRRPTPVFYPGGGSSPKVSCIGALAAPPSRKRLHFYCRLHPDQNLNADRARGFRSQRLRQVRGNLLGIWDGSGLHLARKVEAFLCRHLRRYLEYFPPYAPELNPVEYAWSYRKQNPLAQHPPTALSALAVSARRSGPSRQRQQKLLRSFLRHRNLFLRLK